MYTIQESAGDYSVAMVNPLDTELDVGSAENIAFSMGVLGGNSPLFNLPLEIRLQIYGWVHAMHPVEHAQLAPWYPTPIHSAYFLKLVIPAVEIKDLPAAAKGKTKTAGDDIQASAREEPLLSAHRPLSGLPSNLMCASKKIYNECRALPLHLNEFVFVNWFSSGLWAARAFTRGLQPWQRDELRYVRLEMLGRDFTGPALEEWIELCGHWTTGLRGLRLKILIGGGIFEPTATFATLNGNAEAQAMALKSKTARPEPRPHWIEEGLKKMRALRRLEVELSVLDWGNDEKIEWCAELGRILNDGRRENGREKVVVRCVERLMEDRGPKRQVVGDFAKS